ncbi:methylmalonyl Co-A mutase-associated GTPase MeaB [soil metagenome]
MGELPKRRAISAEALVQGVLTGNRLLLARAISHAENEHADAHSILRAVFPHTGHAHIIGITGAPGTGKSTLVTTLARHYRAAGLTVGIVAIDPTSPFTGGALLGDRVRMRVLSGDNGIFMRSMATRGSLGGLSKTTNDVVTLLDAAGFDRILVETVGVGQAEVEIASLAHTTLVVEAPGLGDEVQAIKAGILEIADILVVNKADRPGVDKTVKALEMMLETEGSQTRQLRHHGQLLQVEMPTRREQPDRWQVTVLKTVAASGDGIEALRQRVEAHRTWLHTSGELSVREQLRIAHTLENIMHAELNRRIRASLPLARLHDMVETIGQRTIDPYTVADRLLAEI